MSMKNCILSTASSIRVVCPSDSALKAKGSDKNTRKFWVKYRAVSEKQKLWKETLESHLVNDDLDNYIIEEIQCGIKRVIDAYQKVGITTNIRVAVDRLESDAKKLVRIATGQIAARQNKKMPLFSNVKHAKTLKANSIDSQVHVITTVPKSTGHAESIKIKRSSSHSSSYTKRSSVTGSSTNVSPCQRKLREGEKHREELEDELLRIEQAEELASKQAVEEAAREAVELAKKLVGEAAREAEARKQEAEGRKQVAIPNRQGCDVGILIGYNCAQALAPREVISGEGNEPFAVTTDHGWSMVGAADKTLTKIADSPNGYSHRVETREITCPTKELHSLDLNQKTLPPARTLGVGWCTDSDRFQFYMNLKEEPATRWEIRSTFAPVYGPLGLIAPYPPQRRQIMQELCKLKSTLDEELDEGILVKCKMKSSVALPPPGTLSGADVYSRERWRQVQWLANAFREGRRKTCLASLQALQKWSDKKCCLKEGDLVILKEDNPIRGTWRLEIVDSVEVSSDGLTRSVRLRMSTDRLTDKGGGQSRVPIDQFTSWW